VVDDKPNDIKGSSTYFNFQARVHDMIEIFSQVRQLFFSRVYFFQASKNFHFIRKFLHGDLVRYRLKVRKVRRNFATTTKPYFYPSIQLGCDHWVYDLSAGETNRSRLNTCNGIPSPDVTNHKPVHRSQDSELKPRPGGHATMTLGFGAFYPSLSANTSNHAKGPHTP